MKATIIGSDLLVKNGEVSILEINTNTTIYNEGAELLDYDGLFSMLIDNNIDEFHFIFTETDSHLPLYEPYRFKQKLIDKCNQNNITFNEYTVPKGSVTVPYIEDASNKFILRQSYDTTALVDETYCADKFGFFSLMSGSSYIPKTSFNGVDLQLNELDSVDFSDLSHPNVVIKARNPEYNSEEYPQLYSLEDSTQLSELISSLEGGYLIQEFVYDSENIVDGKYNVIRGIDIIYGSNLDVISLGAYKQSTVLPLSFSADEYVDASRKLNQKSRFKYITKQLGAPNLQYHTDEDSVILDYTGSLKDVDTIQLGDYIRSIDFTDYNDNPAGNLDQTKLETFGWSGSLEQSNDTLTQLSSSLQNITSASIDTLYVRITTADGKSWVDAPGCTYYIEESGSLATRFEKVNKLYVGDKLVVTDSNTQTLTTIEITNLEMEHAQMTIYNLDFEPSDLFLVDLGEGSLFSVMHNSCWCPWQYCGYYCRSSYCSGCGFQPPTKL